MAHKRHNSLNIEYPIKGLPRDWRRRVEEVVRTLGIDFELFVNSVKAGERKDPSAVLVSITREGAEAAWTKKCENTLSRRIVQVLDSAKAEEEDRKAMALGLRPSAWDLIPAHEPTAVMSDTERTGRNTRRRVLLTELASTLKKGSLPKEARALADIALKQMKEPSTWSLWARLLLTVEETRRSIPRELEERIVRLLSEGRR